MTGRDGKKEIFSPLLHSPNDLNGLDWARLKPGASSQEPGSSSGFLYWCQRFKYFLTFPRYISGTFDGKWSAWDSIQLQYGVLVLQVVA